MKNLIIIGLLTFSSSSFAARYGSDNIYNCSDASGNSYTVNKLGFGTTVNGYNSNTGSSWSQNSNRIGDTTYIRGNSNGKAWNETITPYSTTGTDSKGKYYSYPNR